MVYERAGFKPVNVIPGGCISTTFLFQFVFRIRIGRKIKIKANIRPHDAINTVGKETGMERLKWLGNEDVDQPIIDKGSRIYVGWSRDRAVVDEYARRAHAGGHPRQQSAN